MGIKRVLNWAWYGFENFGDDLLQNVMLCKLKEKNIDSIFPMKVKYPNLKAEQLSRSYRELFIRAKDCNALIVGPGGLFPFANRTKLAVFYAAVIWWKIKQRKVVFLGIGISKRIDWISSFLWKRIIKRCDLFFTRSNGFLETVEVAETDTIRTIADIAFASAVAIPSTNACVEKRVGIAVTNLFENANLKQYESNISVWNKVCKSLIESDYIVDLIAFTKGKDDMMISDIIKNLPENIRGGVQQIHYNEVSDAVAKWNQYEQVICMRFHSLILSILANVPALPIAYGHKTASLAKECGLDNYLLYYNPAEKSYFGNLVTIDSQSIIEKFHAIQEHKDKILSDMDETRKKLVSSAKSAVNLVMDYIG